MGSRRLSPLRIQYDDQIFRTQRAGGISRYFTELMRAIGQLDRADVQLQPSVRWTSNVHLQEAGLGRPLPRGLPWPLRRRLQEALNDRRLERNPDVLHHTQYDAAFLRRDPARIRAVTVFDMIPEMLPEYFPNGSPHHDKRAFVNSADLIVCISEVTRRDLFDCYGPSRVPTVVIPLGVSDAFRPQYGPISSPGAPYLLFVGKRSGYKDFEVLLKAVYRAGPQLQSYSVVAVGGGSLSSAERELVQELGLVARVRQTDAIDSELPALYGRAACYVSTSRYEGFGLPTLEAMACGTPVVLSRTPAHVEVGGDSARYFAVGDPADLESRLLEAVGQTGAARLDAGRRRAGEFSWRRTATLTLDAYGSALSQGHECT